jgi:thioredoxin-related protein
METHASRYRSGSWQHVVRMFGVLLLAVGGLARAQPSVADAGDLQRLGATVRAESTPLVLVIWAHDCPYCGVLEKQVLQPLLASGELDGRGLLRRIDLEGELLRDFDGRQVSGWSFAGRYRARLTPTVLFLDAEGNELAERLVGINSVDFYPAYLDRAIDAAGARLRAGEFLVSRP